MIFRRYKCKHAHQLYNPLSNLDPFTNQLFILLIIQSPNFVTLHVCSAKYGAPNFVEIGKALQNLCCHMNRTQFNILVVLLRPQTGKICLEIK